MELCFRRLDSVCYCVHTAKDAWARLKVVLAGAFQNAGMDEYVAPTVVRLDETETPGRVAILHRTVRRRIRGQGSGGGHIDRVDLRYLVVTRIDRLSRPLRDLFSETLFGLWTYVPLAADARFFGRQPR